MNLSKFTSNKKILSKNQVCNQILSIIISTYNEYCNLHKYFKIFYLTNCDVTCNLTKAHY